MRFDGIGQDCPTATAGRLFMDLMVVDRALVARHRLLRLTASGDRALIDQDKGDFEIDAVLRNFAVLHDDLLLLDPRTLDILECLGCTIDALLNGIIEALFGTGNYLRDSGYRHCFLLGVYSNFEYRFCTVSSPLSRLVDYSPRQRQQASGAKQ
jgi:hypothetical protein